MNIAIERLVDGASAFARLTFPRYRPQVEQLSQRTVAIAASSGLQPVGLALAEYPVGEAEARLLSLFVVDSARQQGVGSALLQSCEAALAEAGCKSVAAYYSSCLASAPAFAATLRRAGWQGPQLLALRSAGRCGELAAAITEWPGVRRLRQNSEFSFAPWSTVTEADDFAIARLTSERTCRPYMYPETWKGEIELRISCVVRRCGQMVGWVLFRVDPDSPEPILHCESGYIQRDLWRTGMLVVGYRYSYEAAIRHFGPDTVVRFFTTPSMPGMMALVRRRFAPVSIETDEWLSSSKQLSR